MSNFRFLTAGESHGPCLIVILEGIPAGLSLSVTNIDADLQRRQKGYGRGGRMRIEKDSAEILSGVLAGESIGAPIALRIANRDWENWRDRDWPRLPVPRPGHADLSGYLKYELAECRPVLERASARETAARVAAGAVARRFLASLGVEVGSYVSSIGNAGLAGVTPDWGLLAAAAESDVSCPDADVSAAMRREIDAAKEDGDSLGGLFTVLVNGLPPGLGTHIQWDKRLDGRLAQAIMSIPAVKGLEIGPAFSNARRRGTLVHDALLLPEERVRLTVADAGRLRPSNRCGGLEGGMTTGQMLVINAAMKPIPTTVAPQATINLDYGTASMTEYQRSDVCAVPAAAVVAEAMVCLILADAVLEKFAGDSMKALYAALERYLQQPLIGRS